ncbi:MAG TPA: restriction endonuclease subunit S [Candidatus Blautia merdigallinarum]|uniref:Restriction endonuclease subunit S n=1 Tax=Candidatus Blautia merdigallinarum TaxID=2838495 RepID=A0A9D2SK49_9FIRM|nr:restriction endonuclease subunit S [Candidatus Blautia merdigallinarum]
MDAWRKIRLGDACKMNVDSYSPKEKWDFINYLDTGNITDNRIDSIQYIDVRCEKLPSRARRKVRKDSIIYSTVRPNQRHFGIIKSQPEHFLVSTGFTVIDVDSNVLDADFLYYLLTQSALVEALHAIAEQSTSAYPSIKPSDIGNLEIEIPDLVTQKKIADVLESLDRKITQNTEINENLEQQAQALFKSWFLDYDPWNGCIPDSWIKGKLGDFTDIKRGGSPRPIQQYLSDTGLRWLKISDVTSLHTPFVIDIKEHIIKEGLKKTVLLKKGALVLSNSATPGIPKILDVDSCIHDGWLYFPESKFSKEYLYLYFKYIRQQLVNLSNGSVFNNLKIDILKGYPTILPDEDILKYFDGIVKPIFLQIQNLTRESYRLADIRDTILPQLMTGRIDVSDIIL